MTAKTLVEILDHPDVALAMDRSHHINTAIRDVKEMWHPDIEQRRPSPAGLLNIDGRPVLKPTDLDLSSVLWELAERKAVIDIPTYRPLRPKSYDTGITVLNRNNRHGQLLRLVSHRDSHSFNVLIMDHNIVKHLKRGDVVGDPRCFMVVGDDGKMYEGWKNFRWKPTPQERAFIDVNNLETQPHRIAFRYFVHPNLAYSIYGSPYLVAKILDARIDDQARFFRDLTAKLKDEFTRRKLKLPKPPWKEYHVEPVRKKGKKEAVVATGIEAKVLMPQLNGEYNIYGARGYSQNGLLSGFEGPFDADNLPRDAEYARAIYRYSEFMADKLTYRYGPMVRSYVRAVELAFFLYGFRNERAYGNEIRPGWDVPQWERNYTEPGKRVQWNTIRWNMLDLNPHVKLLYRIRDRSVQRRPISAPSLL